MRFWIILNSPEMAKFCINNGVDRIFLDLEKLGKKERQGHLNTWKSNHKNTDISLLRKTLPKTKLIVRLNPWHINSNSEINYAIENGADFLMLPMIKSLHDISSFCYEVSNQVPIIPLIETQESLNLIPKIIKLSGVKEIYIGLNDLSISLKNKFIFEPLINKLLEEPAKILNNENIPWGFGGIARYGEGLIPAELIMGEHVRLGSNRVILSRTFHRNAKDLDNLVANMDFSKEIKKLVDCESEWSKASKAELEENTQKIKSIISAINK